MFLYMSTAHVRDAFSPGGAEAVFAMGTATGANAGFIADGLAGNHCEPINRMYLPMRAVMICSRRELQWLCIYEIGDPARSSCLVVDHVARQGCRRVAGQGYATGVRSLITTVKVNWRKKYT